MYTYNERVRDWLAEGGRADETRIKSARKGRVAAEGTGQTVMYLLVVGTGEEEVVLAWSIGNVCVLEWWRDAGFPLDDTLPPKEVFDPDKLFG